MVFGQLRVKTGRQNHSKGDRDAQAPAQPAGNAGSQNYVVDTVLDYQKRAKRHLIDAGRSRLTQNQKMNEEQALLLLQ